MRKILTEKIIKDSVGIFSPKIVVQFNILSFNIFLLNFVSISQDSRDTQNISQNVFAIYFNIVS